MDVINENSANYDKINKIIMKQLPWEEKLTIMWGWTWRAIIVSVITIIVSFILAFLVGMFIGLILLALKINPSSETFQLKLIGGTIGVIIGFLSTYPLLTWITNVKIGDYKFILTKVDESGVDNSIISHDS